MSDDQETVETILTLYQDNLDLNLCDLEPFYSNFKNDPILHLKYIEPLQNVHPLFKNSKFEDF